MTMLMPDALMPLTRRDADYVDDVARATMFARHMPDDAACRRAMRSPLIFDY